MTLLASLELTRRRRLLLRQVRPFSELWLYRREPTTEDDALEDGEEELGEGEVVRSATAGAEARTAEPRAADSGAGSLSQEGPERTREES
jgi:hypothetical protein